jgi:hypothetical protein
MVQYIPGAVQTGLQAREVGLQAGAVPLLLQRAHTTLRHRHNACASASAPAAAHVH